MAELTHHVAEHPLREQLVAQLMLALHRSGRQADALATYRSTRERLVRELGAEPGAELQRLHTEVLRTAEPVHQKASQLPLGVRGFVGRRAELASLDAATAVATITGTAGVGKTALAVHWAHRVAGAVPGRPALRQPARLRPRRPALDPGRGAARLPATRSACRRSGSRPASDEPGGLYRSLLAGGGCWSCSTTRATPNRSGRCCPARPAASSLVTSRDQLTGLVAAEGAHPVAPRLLTDAEAARAAGRRLGAAGSPPSRAAVDEIVALCRLPLALAIVAAGAPRSPAFSLAAIAPSWRTRCAWTPSAAATPRPTSGRSSPGPTAR